VLAVAQTTPTDETAGAEVESAASRVDGAELKTARGKEYRFVASGSKMMDSFPFRSHMRFARISPRSVSAIPGLLDFARRDEMVALDLLGC
jgi:hypothetical protein